MSPKQLQSQLQPWRAAFMPDILLRIVEGAYVALYRHDASLAPEVLPTRGHLYVYSGGFEWGRGDAAALNLSHAIVGKIFEFDGYSKPELKHLARRLHSELISKLDREAEYDIRVDKLKRLLG
ncbi:hypothetical protein M2650_15740 [Luteimonas sp. SX5]|uniref:Uncharacterized protein n=1 Tax=Luteimonas galliterrae TaxID=2940486 RepID=A0ABT0MMG7_9GAMM|nr:hypothetical protein [Luteimonas galliterrae]MCL1636076.1 hypothetical protein [Luteimonas galliterrae]